MPMVQSAFLHGFFWRRSKIIIWGQKEAFHSEASVIANSEIDPYSFNHKKMAKQFLVLANQCKTCQEYVQRRLEVEGCTSTDRGATDRWIRTWKAKQSEYY